LINATCVEIGGAASGAQSSALAPPKRMSAQAGAVAV
jgi:hypothetical protein